MNINKATIDLVKEFEGCNLTAYRDPVGIWTIGYGTTARAGLGIIPTGGMTITQEDADQLLADGLNKFADQIRPMITADLNDNQFGACVSLAYNIGAHAFGTSSVLKHIISGDYDRAANAILLWNKAGSPKKVLKGLVRRREAERKLFLTPVFEQAPEFDERISPVQSTTMQASALQIASGAGAGIAALGSLSGTAQVVALGFAGIVVLAGLYIMRERLRHWANGVR
jgi:lysozyme